MSKKLLAFALALMLGLPLLYYFSPNYYFSPEQKAARLVNQLVERNIAARGGDEAWQAVSALRLSGKMDLGQGMVVPYVLEQKRPGKMRFEFEFDGETAIQSFDGKAGWKLLPFRGKTKPEPMNEAELKEAADTADLYGLLFDYSTRGHILELVGHEQIAGRDTFKLKVTLPGGSVRWVYLDAETALEVKLDKLRTLGRRELLVETYYYEWKAAEGLLIPHRQETWSQGSKDSYFITAERVQVNPALADDRFIMPATAAGLQQVSF
jgi:hypothetical protein